MPAGRSLNKSPNTREGWLTDKLLSTQNVCISS